MNICELEASKRGFLIDINAKDKIREMCDDSIKAVKNGNGRFCRNLIENSILNFALRNYGDGEVNGGFKYVLKKEDFFDINVFNSKDNQTPIGFHVFSS